jgi:hypothetical protein
MSIDANVAGVILGLFGVVNTALLVYQAVRLGQVHTAVDGAHAAALDAAHNAGLAAGIEATRSRTVLEPPS